MINNNSQKGFAMPIIIAIVAVVLVLGGVVYYANRSDMEEDKMEQEKVMFEEKAMMPARSDAEQSGGDKNDGEAMMKKEEGAMMIKSAPLLDFTKADYDIAFKSDKLVVLYFYANWCPICKAEFPVMQKVFSELATDKVIGFRVNYNDDQTDNDEKNLAREFGVAYQHTKVFVKNGKRILKSPEGWDEKRYDMEISKALAE